MIIFAGCGEGCEAPEEVEEGVELEEKIEEAALVEEVVAVARMPRFNERHRDLRHWRETAVEANLPFAGGEPGIIPTAEVRLFIEELLVEAAPVLQWDGHLEVVLWKPEEVGGEWRWALSLPRAEGPALQEMVDWPGEGRYRVSDRADAETVAVFERISPSGSRGTYYVAETATVPSRSGTHAGQSLTISNFPRGAAQIGEAIELTGHSGRWDAELYLWPRRWGITDRYLSAAELMEQQMALHAHDLLPARVGLLRLQTQMYRALANPDSWPEAVRLSLQTFRDSDEGNVRRARVVVDTPSQEGQVLYALHNAMRETNLQGGPHVEGDVGQVGLILRPREIDSFAAVAIPEPWLQLMSIRRAGTRALLIEDFNEMLLHNRGPTTIAFFDGGPRELTAETFVGWQASDGEYLPEVARRFNRRLLQDFWMPVFDEQEFARQEIREEIFADEEVLIEEMTFIVDQTGDEVGACWLVRGREYLSYYGVRPCDRLREAAEFPYVTRSGSALSYKGSLSALVDKGYVLPGEQLSDVFQDLDISIEGRRFSQGSSLEFSVHFPLEALGQIVSDSQHLQDLWTTETYLDPQTFLMELSLQQATYQEPGLAAMGVPGMAGVLPTSYLLGMPFSFVPAPPTLFHSIYLDEEQE